MEEQHHDPLPTPPPSILPGQGQGKTQSVYSLSPPALTIPQTPVMLAAQHGFHMSEFELGASCSTLDERFLRTWQCDCNPAWGFQTDGTGVGAVGVDLTMTESTLDRQLEGIHVDSSLGAASSMAIMRTNCEPQATQAAYSTQDVFNDGIVGTQSLESGDGDFQNSARSSICSPSPLREPQPANDHRGQNPTNLEAEHDDVEVEPTVVAKTPLLSDAAFVEGDS